MQKIYIKHQIVKYTNALEAIEQRNISAKGKMAASSKCKYLLKIREVISILIMLIIANSSFIAARGLQPTSMGRALDKTYSPSTDVIFDGSLSHDNDSQTKGFTPKWQWDFEYDYDLDVFTADLTTTVSTTSKKYLYPGTYVVAVKYIDDDGVEGSIYKFTITITNVKRYYYVKDHLGSIRQTIDDNGVVVEKQDYSSYGAILTGRSMNTASSNEKYKFTEKERDKESGLDYFGARYYDSEIGRWLSIDPLADKYPGWSPYNYCLNNPARNIDPNGEDVIVLNASKGGFKLGHNALLVGNKEMGYTYYSKDGSNSSGSRGDDNTVRFFNSLDEFNNSELSKEYNRRVTFETSMEVDDKVEDFANEEIGKKYITATNNCGDFVKKSLAKADIVLKNDQMVVGSIKVTIPNKQYKAAARKASEQKKAKSNKKMKVFLSFVIFELLCGYLESYLIVKEYWTTMMTLPAILLSIFTIVYFIKIKCYSKKSGKILLYILSVTGLFFGKLLDYLLLIVLNPLSYPGIVQIEEGLYWLILLFIKNLIVFSISFLIPFVYYRIWRTRKLGKVLQR